MLRADPALQRDDEAHVDIAKARSFEAWEDVPGRNLEDQGSRIGVDRISVIFRLAMNLQHIVLQLGFDFGLYALIGKGECRKEPSTGLQHAKNLAKRSGYIGKVFEDFIAKNEIEGRIGEG